MFMARLDYCFPTEESVQDKNKTAMERKENLEAGRLVLRTGSVPSLCELEQVTEWTQDPTRWGRDNTAIWKEGDD